MNILMKCGCTAQGTVTAMKGVKLETPIPGCLVHDCFEPATDAPDLTGRSARCAYYGKSVAFFVDRMMSGCDACRKTKVCKCEQPSSLDLAFFKHEPTKPFDTYFCGCMGWD